MKIPKHVRVKIIEHYEDNAEGTWMIPYGNLMTVLMILFLILYSYTHMLDKKQYEEVVASMQQDLGGDETTQQLRKILQGEKVEDMETILDRKGLKKFVDVIINEEGMKITLRNPVLFKIGEAELGARAKSVLGEVVELMKGAEDDVVVEGYTCSMPVRKGGRYKSNWDLSAARAFSVVRYFINLGMAPERLSGIGYGAYRPKYPNDTGEHRAMNRRIEINVITKK